MTKFKKFTIVLIIFLSTYTLTAIAWRITYNDPNHTCRDMSIEVHDTLALFGIPSQIVYGHRTNTETGQVDKHCWVRVFGFNLEATNLLFFNTLGSYHVDGIFDNVAVYNMTDTGRLVEVN